MSCRRFLLLVVVASIVAACLAPAAWAVNASVRVEASSETVAPKTTVTVGTAPTFYDSSGNPYVTKKPNALAALAAAADTRDFTWEAAYAGSFVTNIGGFTSLPDYSEGWTYSVNGAGYPIVDVAAIDFSLAKGDRILWAQDPDATFTLGSVALVVRTDKTAYTTGEPLTITVVADDLGKVNSQADYDRHELSDPSLLETPDEFAPVADATVHVGSATYTTAADGTVTIASPDAGTTRIWAEKAMDSTRWYIRSSQDLVNDADTSAHRISVTPTKFVPGTRSQVPSASPGRQRVNQVRNAKKRPLEYYGPPRRRNQLVTGTGGPRAASRPRHARYTHARPRRRQVGPVDRVLDDRSLTTR